MNKKFYDRESYIKLNLHACVTYEHDWSVESGEKCSPLIWLFPFLANILHYLFMSLENYVLNNCDMMLVEGNPGL